MNRITLRSLIAVPVLLVFLCAPSITSADPITWTLSGVTFDDGTMATGSFVFDANTATILSAAIVTSAGTLPGATYTGMNLGTTGMNAVSDPLAELVFVPTPALTGLAGTPVLDLIFSVDLSNAGGVVGLVGAGNGGVEATCLDDACTAPNISAPARLIEGGEVEAPVVSTPEPSALLLLGVGLVAFVGTAKRKVLQA